MATVGGDMGFELGDFAKKSEGKKSYLTWHIEEGGGSINSTPVIRGPHVYIAAMDGYLYKLDKESGKEVWKFKAGGMFSDSYPVFSNGLIFLGSYDHNFYAIDEESGTEVWRFQSGGKIDGSSGLLIDGMVIFTSRDYYVYSLDQKTGKMIWAFRTGGWSCSCPTEHDGRILVGSSDGNMYCLSKEGKELWRFQTGGNIFSQNTFCMHEGIVYFGSDDSIIYGVRITDGQEVWRFKTGGYVNVVPIIHDGALFVVGNDSIFYSIDLLTKRAVWQFKTGSKKDSGSTAIIIGSNVIFGSADSNVYCLESKTGKEIWRYKTDGHIFGKPVLDDGRIYVGSYDCHLHCITTDGKLLWLFQTSTLNPNKYEYESESVFEFKPPEIKETFEEEKEKYSSHETSVTHESTYSVQSEYVTKSEYA